MRATISICALVAFAISCGTAIGADFDKVAKHREHVVDARGHVKQMRERIDRLEKKLWHGEDLK